MILTPKMFGQQLRSGHWSTDGLIFYWRGIEAGNVVDESFYRNHGTITGATWVGGSLLFDGSDPSTSYVNIGAIPLQGKDLTIVMRIKSLNTVAPSAQWIYKQWIPSDGVQLYGVGTALRFQFGLFANRLEIPNAIVQGTRQHIVATRKGTTLSIYIDGNLAGSGTRTITHTTNETAYISGNSDGGVDAFNGHIDYCAVYNRALSASEIQQLSINPDLPMQQEPVWQMYSPAAPSGIVPIIQAHTRRRRAG